MPVTQLFPDSHYAVSGPMPSLLASACATLVAVALAVLAPNASAKDSVISSSLIVPYGDLDVADEHDAAVLLQRIEDTADRICWNLWRSSALRNVRIGQCRRATIERAVKKADIEPLTWAWTGAQMHPGPRT